MKIGKQAENKAKDFDYDGAFRINLGVLFRDEQEKLRQARLLIVGAGGAGGVMAIVLARSGIANFILVDPDVDSESNLNRQIGCFVDTLGKYKSEVIKGEMLRINPGANVIVYTKKFSFEELEKVIDNCDICISEADDLAYSSYSIVMAQKKKKFTMAYMPSGLTVIPCLVRNGLIVASLMCGLRLLPDQAIY